MADDTTTGDVAADAVNTTPTQTADGWWVWRENGVTRIAHNPPPGAVQADQAGVPPEGTAAPAVPAAAPAVAAAPPAAPIAPPSLGSIAAEATRPYVLPPGSGATVPEQIPQSIRDAMPPLERPAEARSFNPPVTDKLGDLVQSALSTFLTPRAAEHFADRTKEIAGYLPGLGEGIAAGDTTRSLEAGNYPGAALSAAGLIIPGAGKVLKKGVKAATSTGEKVAEAVVPGIGHNMPPPDVTGSLNPLANETVTFGGKEPSQLSPEQWQKFGEHYGVPNLGPLSPVQTLTDESGRQFQVPGGTQGNWTYYDLLHMKANPINPSEMGRGLHAELQAKLGRTMSPENLSDADVWNGLVFGMTSPNNPLFPNQVAQSRLRLRDPKMLDDLAGMIPWKPGEQVSREQRLAVSDQIARRYGLASEEKGGLGVRGSADYSRVGEMAQLFKMNPNFFRKQPGEDWGQAVERIASQLPGLSMKTGSFGTVWQDPAQAAISAIDRHMARELEAKGGLFASPEERTAWENRGVNLWNKRIDKETADNAKKGLPPSSREKASGWTDLLSKSGSDGFVGEMLLDHVGKALEPKFRLASGQVNPNLPPHLAQANWVREPATVFKMGAAYKRALELNQQLADKSGLGLFMSQWMEWDRIRNRLEPHENMFPGLSKMPAPSVDQLRGVDAAHRATGHKTYTKDEEARLPPTRAFKGSPSQMGYLGLGGAMVPLYGQQKQEGDTAD